MDSFSSCLDTTKMDSLRHCERAAVMSSLTDASEGKRKKMLACVMHV